MKYHNLFHASEGIHISHTIYNDPGTNDAMVRGKITKLTDPGIRFSFQILKCTS